jgi:hypothetical protein
VLLGNLLGVESIRTHKNRIDDDADTQFQLGFGDIQQHKDLLIPKVKIRSRRNVPGHIVDAQQRPTQFARAAVSWPLLFKLRSLGQDRRKCHHANHAQQRIAEIAKLMLLAR